MRFTSRGMRRRRNTDKWEVTLTVTGEQVSIATMMIAGGTDVRTVASYLGHSSVSMTLNTYADVDPDAKLQAVGKIEDSFDIDMAGICGGNPLSAPVSQPKVPDVTFTIEQLEAMLAQAKRIEEAQ